MNLLELSSCFQAIHIISYTTCVVRKAETGILIPCNKLTSEDLQMMGDALVN